MRQLVVVDRASPDTATLLIVVVFAVGCFCHFFRIDVLPKGIYFDEASIAYNAHLISQTGTDEHGAHWPLFFEAFGEYKNPLYIYALAACYRLLGYSEWTTRAVSAFFWVAGTCCLYALARRLFADNTVRLYIALCLAFTPWLFALSRVSFEVIALYPLLALHLLALHHAFEEGSWKWALVSGMAIALCVYAYTTYRLFSPLQVALVLACYFSPRYRKLQVSFVLGAAISASPYVLYAWRHFDALRGRFDTLTYLQDPALSVAGKFWVFITHYAGYASPSFLAICGDDNRRHHSGFGGELLFSTVVLLCVACVRLPKEWRNPFRLYLAASLLLAPTAAALTRDTHHSLRAFSMVIFAIPLSAYGLSALRKSLARAAVVLTALCALPYVIHYFTIYPAESAGAFQDYGFKEALHEAVNRTHGRVVVSNEHYGILYIDLLFFSSLAPPTRVPLLIGSRGDVRPGDAYIFYDPGRGMRGLYGVDLSPTSSAPGK